MPSTPLAPTYELTTADFERVRSMIHAHAGISLNEGKRSMVYSRLSRRLRELGCDDFRSYLDALAATPGGQGEWQHFVNALTTNLTYFYREPHHFPILAQAPAASRARGLRRRCGAAPRPPARSRARS